MRIRALLVAVLLAALAVLPAPLAKPTPTPPSGPRGPSLTRGVTRRLEAANRVGGELAYRRRHALVVGVNQYLSGPFGSLTGPGNDAAEVAAELALRYGFEDVDLLLDASSSGPEAHATPSGVHPTSVAAVTRAVLADHLHDLRSRVEPDDALLFFYAGHGMRLGAHGFLVPADADPEHPETLLDLAEVARALRACKAHHTLMVLDCCFSGAALEPGSGVPEAVGTLEDRPLRLGDGGNLARVFSRPAFQVITAGTGTESVGDLVQASREYAELAKSLPEFQGHSPFTAVFLQALRGLTGRPDGKQLASDLGYYLTNTLVNDERIRASQAPRYGSLGGDGEFVFFPTHKVLDPRLVAPLYLFGPQYAEPRQSACRALRQYIAAQPSADREGLARAAVPHLVRLLRDAQDGPRMEGVRALADLAEGFAERAPEFAQAVGPLATVVRDDGQPADVRREGARALGQLGRYADGDAVAALAGYVHGREKAWSDYERQLAEQLHISPEPFRLPEEMRARLDAIPTPSAPDRGASFSEQTAYLEAAQRRLGQLSPEALDVYVRRHERGKAFLTQAEKLLAEGDRMGACMTAATALGFRGFGRPEGNADFAANHVEWLFPLTPEWKRAEELATAVWRPRFVWCSPVADRHTGSVNSVAFSPDGRRIVTGGQDGTVHLWDAATGVQTAVLAGHTAFVKGVAFSPDGKVVASASGDGTVRLWNALTGTPGYVFRGHVGKVFTVAIAPDGKTVASAGEDKTVRLWDAATGTAGLALSGHTGPVYCVAFSPDGKAVASASYDKTVRLWDAAKGGAGVVLEGHTAPVVGVAFAPDGKAVGSASEDKTVRLWDASTHAQTAVLDMVYSAKGVAFSPDGKSLASFDNALRLWDVATRTMKVVIQHYDAWYAAVAFSPDGKSVAGGGQDGGLYLWDAATGEPTLPGEGHKGPVFSVSVAPDGRTVASGSCDGTIRLWDMATGAQAAVLRGHTGSVVAVAFSPDGKTLASGGQDNAVRLWDVAAGAQTAVLQGHTAGVYCVAFSPDGNSLASGGEDRTARLWDAATHASKAVLANVNAVHSVTFSPDGQVLASVGEYGTVRLWDSATGAPKGVMQGVNGTCQGVAFSPDGKTLAVGCEDGAVRLWNVGFATPAAVLRGHTASVYSLAFSLDGKTVASGSADGTVRLWDSAAGVSKAVLRGHVRYVRGLAFTPDGRGLASGGQDCTVRLWDVAAGLPTVVLRGHTEGVYAGAISPDGKTLASGAWDGTVRLWDAASGAQTAVLRLPAPGVYCVAFSPDGKVLVSGDSEGTVRQWDAATGAAKIVLRGHTASVRCVAFSPDGKTLASGGEDGVVRLWDAATGARGAVLRGHIANATGFTVVYDVAFSPDGKTIASAGYDGTVRLWDAATGAQKNLLGGHAGLVASVTFSPDGKTLVSGDEKGTVRLWDAASGAPKGLLQGHTGIVWRLAFSPDGRTLATGSSDGTTRLWDAATGTPTAFFQNALQWAVPVVAFSPDGRTLALSAKEKGAFSLHAAPEPCDLTAYLPSVAFNDLDVAWVVPDSRSARAGGLSDSRTLPPDSYLRILRSGKVAEETTRELLAAFLRAGNLDGARLLLSRLPEESARREWGRRLADALRPAAARAMDGRDFARAEQRLSQARELDPDRAENEYIAARLEALRTASGGATNMINAFRDVWPLLERAVTEGFADAPRLEADPAFAPMRDDARFKKLAEDATPPDEWARRAEALERTDAVQAIALADRALAKDANLWQALAVRGLALARKGDHDGAEAALRKALERTTDRALVLLDLARAHALYASGHAQSLHEASAMQGRIGPALDVLEQAVGAGWADWGQIDKEPDLQPLHGDARYKELALKAAAMGR